MSIVVVNEVLDSSRSKGSARVLMIVLAEQAGEDGLCWPGLTRLARRVNTTERNIQLITRDLEDMGELIVDYGSGRGNTNLYRVIPEATANRLIQDLTEQLERVKNSAERVKLSALLERVKLSAERVKLFDERVKPSAKRVKPASPEPLRTLEPKEEPTAAGEGTQDAAAAAGQIDTETAPQDQGSAAGAGTPDGAQAANATTGHGITQATTNAGQTTATDTEQVPGAPGAARAALVAALKPMDASALLAETPLRVHWLDIPADQIRELHGTLRAEHGGRAYRGALIEALDRAALTIRRAASPAPTTTNVGDLVRARLKGTR